MKTFIAALLFLLCSASYAQIVLERQLVDSNERFHLIQIDSGEYYYMTHYYGPASVHQGVDEKLFDLDFNLVKEIDLPDTLISGNYVPISYLSRRLFDLDDNMEYLVFKNGGNDQLHGLRIIEEESGTPLFSCDSCTLGGIYNTPRGTKMLIMKHQYIGKPLLPGNRIYSLPGKLPTNHSSSVPDITYIESALDIEMAPNPASENIRVSYRLPAGDLSGYITIRDTKGAELQRHPVHFADGSLSLDVRTLASGTYYCCLLTSDGRTTVKKMMVVR